MRALLNPALTLANVLSFNSKLAILVLMFLIPFLALGVEKYQRTLASAKQAQLQAQGLKVANGLKHC